MADKDVRLIIRAKDAASKEIKSVSEAMKVLSEETKGAASDSKQSVNVMSRLGAEFKRLNSQVKAFEALGKVAEHTRKASESFNSLRGELTATKESFEKSSAATARAKAEAEALRATIDKLKNTYAQQKAASQEAAKLTDRESAAKKGLTAAQKEFDRANRLSAKNPERDARVQSSKAALDAAQSTFDSNVQSQAEVQAAVKKTRAELAALNTDLVQLEKAFRTSEGETIKFGNSVAQAEDNLRRGEIALNELTTTSQEAARSLGLVSAEEAELARRASDATPDVQKLASVLTTLNRLSKGNGQFVDPTTAAKFQKQRAAVEEAEKAWRDLESVAKEMAVSMKAAGQPTAEQVRNFKEITNAARAAKGEYRSQIDALGALQGAARVTFAEFSNGAGPLKKIVPILDENKAKLDALGAAMARYNAGAAGQAPAGQAAALREQTFVVDLAKNRYEILNAEVNRLKTVMASATAPTDQMARELREVSTAANLAEKEFREAAAAMQKLQTAGRGGNFFGSANADARTTLSLYQRLRGEVLALAASFVGFYGAIQGVGGALKAQQTIEAAQNRLGVVFEQNGQKIRAELGFIERQSQRLGIAFGTLSDQYSKFAVSANAANVSNADTRKIFLSVAEAARVNKLSVEDTNGVFLALTQMMQKGKVSSEELRQQLAERLPGAVHIFAESLGVSTAELSKMLEQGEVLADSDTMVKFAEGLNKAFGPQLSKSLESTTKEIGAFQNSIFQAQSRFNEGGFIDAFTRGLRSLNQWFESRAGRDFFLGLGSAAGKLIDVLALIPPNIDLILGVIKAVIATKFAGWIIGLTTASNGVIARAREWAAANVAVATTNRTLAGTLASLRASTVAYAASVGTTARNLTLARSASLVMTTATATLRGGMTLAATAARALWLAIGGWAGIIVTAVSYLATELIGSWLTQVDDVTQSLDEHKQLMSEILTGYDEAIGKTDRWGASLDKISLNRIDDNTRELTEKLDTATDKLKGLADGASLSGVTTAWRGLFGGWDDIQTNVLKLTEAFKSGEKDINSYLKELEDLYKTLNDDAAKEFVSGYIKQAEEVKNLTEALAQSKDAADKKKQSTDGLRGSIDAIKGPLDAMAEATEGVNDKMDAGKLSADGYKESLENIKSFIPELAKEAEKLKEMNELAQNFANGLNSITPEMFRLGQTAVGAINDKYTNFEAKYTGIRNGGSADSAQLQELVQATTILAEKLGVSAKDLLTAMSYETGGSFNPRIMGGKNGQYYGLIQNSPDNQRRYGLDGTESITRQVEAAGEYLTNAGVKAGDGLLQIYAAINAGSAKKIHASDANNGGMPGTVLDKVSGQMGGHEKRAEGLLAAYAGVSEKAKETYETEKKTSEEKAKQAEQTQQTINDGNFEIEQQKLKNAGKEREAAIEAAMREARAQNPDITPDQLARIREQTAQKWDLANALTVEEQQKEKIRALDEAVNNLESQRNGLLAQRKVYAENGDEQGVRDTDAALASVNTKLQEAIDKSIAFHNALGGEKAAATVAQLNATKLAIAQANAEGQKFAMTADEMSGSIYQTLESGIIGLFDTFAQAVANGENAVTALWTAFRQFAANFLLQIAQMIIKQTLFNALQSFSKAAGGGLFSFLSMHSGGVVGASGVGSGSRAVSPAWFSNAIRYHSGGIAGLKPDEVPTVLKQGEEVLTETDPRHRNNGGGSGGGSRPTKVVNMFDAASFLSEAMNSPVGEETILNFVRANPAAFKQALG